MNKRAKQLDQEVRQLVQGIERGWIKLGKLCLECRNKQLFQELGFTRFDEWLESRLGVGKTQTYRAMRAIEELKGQFTEKEIAKMTLDNASTLAKVPTKNRKKLLKAAQEQTANEFSETVQKEVPTAKVESTKLFQVWLEASMHDLAEDVMKRAQARTGGSRATAFEWIISEALQVLDNEPEEAAV